ncbi:squalene synthase HpnC [Plantactinospora endophytica]|uniref:Phytoene synthase n=1 Tax=Plantactinospora endophytica TaxID=673535 RepID=A0ABQ4DXR4_9ACTN|nr:squalene synthase HpnC [Plantactinospora endophytica]GIG87250.1 phytoene synthase [Plantactinospora endophytica]
MLDLTDDAPDHPSTDRPGGRRQPDTVLAGENFPVALRVLPSRIRRHLLALYWYARHVDDLGDEPDRSGRNETPAVRLAALDRFDAEVRALYHGRLPRHPVLVKLAPTVVDCRLPIDPLLRLIEANRRDQTVSRYPTFGALVDYCHLSADPVGELVLHVFGAASPDRIRLSDRICTALQVVEHLQDVAEDRRRGRIYLPTEDLAAAGVPEEDLDAPRAGERLRTVVRRQAQRAADLLDAGAPLLGDLRGWARIAVGGYVAGGRAALTALARAGYDPLPGPPKPTRAGIAAAWVRSYRTSRAAPHPSGARG